MIIMIIAKAVAAASGHCPPTVVPAVLNRHCNNTNYVYYLLCVYVCNCM